MKNIILTILTGVLMVSCGGSSDDDSGNDDVNTAPSKPSLSEPTNKLLCIDNNLTFKWNASTDADGDTIKYNLEVASDNTFKDIKHSFSNLTTVSKTILLNKGTAYYWRVKAKDSKGNDSDYSSVFQLYTEGIGEINYLPFSPVAVSPAIEATVSDLNSVLSWTGSHVTANSTLTYTVYLDINNPPTTEVANSISETTYTSTLNPATTYYWKVVVKDENDGITHGQVWNFKTE